MIPGRKIYLSRRMMTRSILANEYPGQTSGPALFGAEFSYVDYIGNPAVYRGHITEGFPTWSRGPLLHRGENRQLFPLVDHWVQTLWSIILDKAFGGFERMEIKKAVEEKPLFLNAQALFGL